MAILKSHIFGSSLIGVHLEANNSFVLYPSMLIKSFLNKFKPVFKQPFIPLTINNSTLLGVYTASNKNGIILPNIIKQEEFETIQSNVDASYQIATIKSIDNAFGNLILCNDKGAIISTLLADFKVEIEDILGVETVIYEFVNSELPGSVSIANNKGCLVHPLASDEEIEFISSVLKVETDVSTINRGIPYLSSGATVNDGGGIFGADSTGPEMMRLTNVLQL